MRVSPILKGWVRHFSLTLGLNFRNVQAIVYGYLVPVLFLLAFGSVFRADTPALLPQMGQLVTITVLGGACFGLPTALVAERERGIWRRYRLLPVPTAWLVLSVLLARVLIIVSAVLIQMALARVVFGTPFPAHPVAATFVFLFATCAFLGMGLLVAALADDVPAVQALGQCIFLPMILIGGVGVPLSVLPFWAQRVAGFMPGRYAVEALQPCFDAQGAFSGTGFRLAALAVIGLAAGLAGTMLFRWEAGYRIARSARWWVTGAFASWLAIGAIAWQTGRLKPVLPEPAAWANITEAEIAQIDFSGLPGDSDLVTRMAPPGLDSHSANGFAAALARWPAGKREDSGQSVRNLVCVAAIADLCADPREAEIARFVYRQLNLTFEPADLRRALAWIILSPDDGEVITKAPELGLFRHPPQRLVRQRSAIYAKKYLGRLLGKIRE